MNCLICRDGVHDHAIKCEGDRPFVLHYSCAALLVDELLGLEDGEGKEAMREATERARHRRGV